MEIDYIWQSIVIILIRNFFNKKTALTFFLCIIKSDLLGWQLLSLFFSLLDGVVYSNNILPSKSHQVTETTSQLTVTIEQIGSPFQLPCQHNQQNAALVSVQWTMGNQLVFYHEISLLKSSVSRNLKKFFQGNDVISRKQIHFFKRKFL